VSETFNFLAINVTIKILSTQRTHYQIQRGKTYKYTYTNMTKTEAEAKNVIVQ